MNRPTTTSPRWAIDDVLARTDLAALLDEFTAPTGRLGPGRRWHCPVTEHDDVHASVTMFRDRHGHERWRCWSADHRGDAVDLVMLRAGHDRPGAIDWLANRAGMIPDQPLPPIPRRSLPEGAAAAVMDPAIARYVSSCEAVLHGPQGRPVRDWLHGRGLSDETIAANHLGADPGRSFMRRQRGLPYGASAAAVFPALDPAGRVTYVQARYLDPESTGRKYDNPSAVLAPHPRLAWPVAGGERGGVLLVCEGIPDALTAAQAGYTAVGLLGARTPDESVARRIAVIADQRNLTVAVVADPDDAGRHLSDTLRSQLAQLDHDLTTVTPPDGLDLNDWARTSSTWATDLDRRLSTTVVCEPSIDGPEL